MNHHSTLLPTGGAAHQTHGWHLCMAGSKGLSCSLSSTILVSFACNRSSSRSICSQRSLQNLMAFNFLAWMAAFKFTTSPVSYSAFAPAICSSLTASVAVCSSPRKFSICDSYSLTNSRSHSSSKVLQSALCLLGPSSCDSLLVK